MYAFLVSEMSILTGQTSIGASHLLYLIEGSRHDGGNCTDETIRALVIRNTCLGLAVESILGSLSHRLPCLLGVRLPKSVDLGRAKLARPLTSSRAYKMCQVVP